MKQRRVIFLTEPMIAILLAVAVIGLIAGIGYGQETAIYRSEATH